MAFGNSPVDPSKKTGFTFQGREIILSKIRGRKQETRTQPLNEDKKKIEVLTVYGVCGHMGQTAELTGVSVDTIRKWRKEEWFREGMEELRNENDIQFEGVFTKMLEKMVGVIDDRATNGDYVVLRDGTLIRKPVSLRDAVGAMMIAFDKRQMVRNRPTSRAETVSVENRLEKLVQHFTDLSKKTREERKEELQVTPSTTSDGQIAPTPVLEGSTYATKGS